MADTHRLEGRLAVDDGAEIHWELRGPEEGEVVVFLNGILMTTRSWVLQRPVFERRHRCLYHDFRGQLLSSKPPGPYTFERHAADLLALLDLLGVERCHLVGTSYGGEVGMLFAALHPRRVATLSAISCVSHLEPLLAHQVALWGAAGGDAEALFRISAPFNYSNRFLAAESVLVEQGAKRLADYPPDFFTGFERLLECFAGLDLRGRLGGVRCPALVLCGSEDLLKPPAYSAEIAAAIPHSEYLLVPGAGHAVVIEKADTVNTAVLGFLEKHRARS
jgi:3-oxoadipate enol-lactonase